jgi:hypothetical protein
MFQSYLSIARYFRVIISMILTIILFINYPSALTAQQNSRNSITVLIEQATNALKGRKQRTQIKDVKQVNGNQRGGAKRGRCREFIPLKTDEIPLTAFSIQEKESSPSKSDKLEVSTPSSVWSQTTEEYPTFLFYVPYAFKESQIESGKFVLLNKDKKMIAKPVLFKLPDSYFPSIAKFTLPKSMGPLKNGDEYNWYFSIVCNDKKPSRNPSVSGWVEKIESSVSPPTYLNYANKGIWYDAVSRLITSQNLQTLSQQPEWIDLIKFVFKKSVEIPPKDFNQIANEIAKLKIQELKIASENQLSL